MGGAEVVGVEGTNFSAMSIVCTLVVVLGGGGLDTGDTASLDGGSLLFSRLKLASAATGGLIARSGEVLVASPFAATVGGGGGADVSSFIRAAVCLGVFTPPLQGGERGSSSVERGTASLECRRPISAGGGGGCKLVLPFKFEQVTDRVTLVVGSPSLSGLGVLSVAGCVGRIH